MKIAIFLEGHTELIFVKHLLQHKYEWRVDIRCTQLIADENLEPILFDYEVPDPVHHFQLICVGNDKRILTAILDREDQLNMAGYSAIIGLRDMYSEEYAYELKKVDKDLVSTFISQTKQTINQRAKNAGSISFCYAIMEIESWMIGLNIFNKLGTGFTPAMVQSSLKFDINTDDPEIELFKPSSSLAEIYGQAGLKYDKSQAVVLSFCSHITANDFAGFLHRNCCRSYNYFVSKLP